MVAGESADRLEEVEAGREGREEGNLTEAELRNITDGRYMSV